MNPIKMTNIDDIFKNGEHQKALDIRPELWSRLERRLDEHPPARPWKKWLIAASLLLLFSFTTLLYLNIDVYQVEDMTVTSEPRFSKEEIGGLEEVYWVPQSLFVNPEKV